MIIRKSLRQREQSKMINQSRKDFDPCFLMKMMIGTLAPSISTHVIICASLINIINEPSPRQVRNSCSNVSNIRISVWLRIVNTISFISISVPIIPSWRNQITGIYFCSMAFILNKQDSCHPPGWLILIVRQI